MRILFRLFSILAVPALLLGNHGVAAAQICVAPPHGIVGWWPGNGTAQDTIAANDGQLADTTTFAPAIVGAGFKLDGVGDAVEINDSPALKPAHVSVEAWVRFDSLNTPIVSQFGAVGHQYIIFKKNSRVFNFEGYALRKERVNAVDRFVFSVGAASGFGTAAFSTTAIVVGRFYHVVGTYDGLFVNLYVDGVLEDQTFGPITVDYGTRSVYIGTSGEAVFDGKLNGIVDEASIYNRGLDSVEVLRLYQAGAAGKCSSATGYITSLAAFVQTLNLSNGISNSLDAKLHSALEALDAARANDSPSACNKMTAFLNEVSAQTDKTVTAAQADQLIDLATQGKIALGCR